MPAIKPHSTATTDIAWDGSKAPENLKADGSKAYYRSPFAWQDRDADAEPKAAYKFIHHMVASDGGVGAANTRSPTIGCHLPIGLLQ